MTLIPVCTGIFLVYSQLIRELNMPSKKVYIVILIFGAILLSAYLFTRFSFQAKIKNDRAQMNGQPLGDSSVYADQPDTTLDLRPLFKERLRQIVKKGSSGLYDLDIASMDIDVLQSSVLLKQVTLSIDADALKQLRQTGQVPKDLFQARLPQIKIEGINLDDVITRRTLDFKTIRLSGLRLEVEHLGEKVVPKNDNLTLYKRIQQEVKKLAIKEFIVEGGTFIHRNKKEKSKITKLDHLTIRLQDLLIDSTTQHARDRFLFSKKAFIAVKNYSATTPDQLYHFKVDAISVEAPKHLMTWKGIALSTRHNRNQFQKQLTTRKEWYDVSIPSITISNTDWWNMLNKQNFTADLVSVNAPKVKVYLDRSLPPPPSKMGGFPNQLLMDLPFSISVKKLQVRDMSLNYTEFSPVTKQEGTLHFDQLNLQATHLSNLPQRGKKATIEANGLFMGKVPLRSSFTFDLQRHKQGVFSSRFVLGTFEGNIANPIAKTLGLLHVDKGTVKQVTVDIQGDQHKAKGTTRLLYNDLKVTLFEKEADEKGLDKQGLKSKLANLFVIKSDNPKDKQQPRVAETTFNRNPQAGFFNLIWKTALTGILESMGANPKLAEKQQ